MSPRLRRKANPDLAYIVFLAAPAVPTRQLVVTQRRVVSRLNGMREEDIARIEARTEALLDIAVQAASAEEAGAQLQQAMTPEVMEAIGMPQERKAAAVSEFANNWFRYFISHDPVSYLRALAMPVLAPNGSLDVQVDASENIAGMRAALGGNADATVMELAGLNHLFQTAKTGGIDEYRAIEETFAPKALALASDWINRRF